MIRKALGLIAGVIVAMLLVMIIEMVGMYVFPPPPFDRSDPEALREAMARMPAGALMMVLAAYFVGALVGGWAAARVVGAAAWPAWGVAAVVLLSTVVNLFMLPHPLWFAAVAVLLIVLAGWIAGQFAAGRPILPGRG